MALFWRGIHVASWTSLTFLNLVSCWQSISLFHYIYIAYIQMPRVSWKKKLSKYTRVLFRREGIVGILYIVADTAPLRQWGGGAGGGGLEGLWKINTSNSQIKPISDKKKSWAVLTKKVGPFWTGPFRIWAVLSWAVSDLGRFDYNSFLIEISLLFPK